MGENENPAANFTIGKRFGEWTIVKKLDEGGFGQVYRVESNIRKGQIAALKAEPNDVEGGSAIKLEIAILRTLTRDKDTPHIPAVFHAAKHKKYSYMIMTLLGENLKSLKSKGKWTARRARGSAEFRGTLRYCSPNVHEKKEQGRRDDLWSLFYVLIELHCGLPWQTIRDKAKVETIKMNIADKDLVQNFPFELHHIVPYLRMLDCYQRPNYSMFYDGLIALMKRLNVKTSDPYDWETKEQVVVTLKNKRSRCPADWENASEFFSSDPININAPPAVEHMGAVLRCSYNSSHVTHLKCARRFSSQNGFLECSHCEAEGISDIISMQPLDFSTIINKSKSILAVADIAEDILSYWESAYLNGSSKSLLEQFVKLTKMEASNFDLLSINLASSFARTYFAKYRFYEDLREMFLLLVTNCLYNIAEEMCKFVLEDQISISDLWGDGEILSLAIRAEHTNLVRTLRDVGCLVMPLHLHLLTFHYSPALFDALTLDSEYAYVMLSLNDGNSALHYAAASGHWIYVQRLLEHFQYKGISPNMPNNDGKTLLDLCSCAPEDIQNAIQHTFRIAEFSKCFPKKNIVVEDLSNGSERFPVRVVNDVDDSVIDEFVYTTRVVDRTGILAARNSDMVVYCLCTGDCLIECECSSGVYDNKGHIRGPSLDWAFLECSSACACSMRCGNRIAQKGATYAVEVYRTCDNRGWAVRALRTIPCGAFIGEYTGELLNEFEANKRSDSYLFETAVGENNFTIDARLYGNFTRFINHSCEPNGKVGLVVWDSQVEQLSHICIFATRNISKGEEITISYGENWWGTKIFEFSCLCKRLSCQFTEDKRCAILNKTKEEIRNDQKINDDVDQCISEA